MKFSASEKLTQDSKLGNMEENEQACVTSWKRWNEVGVAWDGGRREDKFLS